MRLLMRHPSHDDLLAFDDGALSADARRRVADHLSTCTPCRADIAARRELRARFRTADGPVASPALRTAVMTRLAAGERRLLPAGTIRPAPAMRARTFARVAGIAAACAVLAGGGAYIARLVRPAPLVAGTTAGTLAVTPASPRPGTTVTVTYRPSLTLADAPSLDVRARFRTATDQEGDVNAVPPRIPVVARLERRSDGAYVGAFRFPDSAVYAALAVESSGGATVDANGGRRWELLASDASGRPSLAARDQQVRELFGRDWERAFALARTVARDHPDAVGPAYLLYHFEMELPGTTPRATITARHRERFARVEAHLLAAPAIRPLEALQMMVYARRLDNGRERYWRDHLFKEHGRTAEAAHWRTWDVVWRHERDTVALLRELDAMWREIGAVDRDPAFRALDVAMARQDGDAILRWAARAESAAPAQRTAVWGWVASKAAQPRARDSAITRLRAWLRTPAAADSRPLGMTASAYAAELERERGAALVALGQGLQRAGMTRAALDTLTRAAAAGWDPDVQREILALRLSMGDTTEAVGTAALLAQDPLASPPAIDSMRARLGRYGADVPWSAAMAQARTELGRLVPEATVVRTVSPALQLEDGMRRSVPLIAAGSDATLVLYWSPACAPAIAAIRQVNRWAPALARRGIRVVAVADVPPSAALRASLTKWGVTVPVVHDSRGAGRRALEAWATPTFYVVREGRVIGEHAGLQGAEALLVRAVVP